MEMINGLYPIVYEEIMKAKLKGTQTAQVIMDDIVMKESTPFGNYQSWDHYQTAMAQVKGMPSVVSTLTPQGWVTVQGSLQKQEKVSDMPISPEKCHLQKRLYDLAYTKKDELYTQYGLRDEDGPSTLKDLKQRLDEGRYTFRNVADDSDHYHWTELLRWRDPSVKEDKDGYAEAKKVLRLAELATNDEIVVKEPAAGLEALREFEATDFGPKTKKGK